ncbi:MAG TPA: ATP-binding protein [Caldithrix sp.]|nr:ATP-binding protein [Caldithrix sp.]
MEFFIPRFFKPPSTSYFLFGPRGTGKSTFLRHYYKNALWIDLLKPEVFRKYAARPERMIELVHGNPEKTVVIVDEIQKLPELLSVVHSLIEEKKGQIFVLTGSSARKIKRAGVNLLAGRALLRTLHSFLLSELASIYSFQKALKYGLLPLVVNAENPNDTLETYVALYIREEVQMEGFVRRIGNFSRFLEAISFSHGSVLNLSNVARECQVERKTVEGYVKILEDLMLSFKLPVFRKRARRRITVHPKFYFFDTGVYRSLRPKGPLDRPEEIEGAALEGMVVQHIRAWNSYRNGKYEIYFWRSRGGLEVDFILYGTKAIYGIEIKNSDSIRPKDLRSLQAFHQDYPEAKCILLYRGTETFLRNNILCMPCELFLQKLLPNWEPEQLFQ